jgi:predicted dehydrogenase
MEIKPPMKKLNIGLVGYGFMGRAHSNAYLTVGQFFDIKYQPVLKAVAARDPEKVKHFAHKWGYESHYSSSKIRQSKSSISQAPMIPTPK